MTFGFPWYLSIMVGDNCSGHTDQVLGLIAKEAGGPNDLLQLLLSGVRQILHCWVAGEQLRRHFVDPLVGTLRGKDRCRQELERAPMAERAGDIRIRLVQQI